MAFVRYGKANFDGGTVSVDSHVRLTKCSDGFASDGACILLQSENVVCRARVLWDDNSAPRVLTRAECDVAATMMFAMVQPRGHIPEHLLKADRDGVSQALARLLLSDGMKPLIPRILMVGEVVRPEPAPAEAPETFNVVGYERLVDSGGSSRDRDVTSVLRNVPSGNQYTLDVTHNGTLAKIGIGDKRWTLENPTRVVKGDRVLVRRYSPAEGVAAWRVVGLGTCPSDPPVEPAPEAEPPFRGYKAGPSPSLGRWAQALANVLPQHEPKSVELPPTHRTVDEILRDPPREVLDGFGQKRGPVWEKFCRALAATREAKVILDRIGCVRRPVLFSAGDVNACVAEATKE